MKYILKIIEEEIVKEIGKAPERPTKTDAMYEVIVKDPINNNEILKKEIVDYNTAKKIKNHSLVEVKEYNYNELLEKWNKEYKEWEKKFEELYNKKEKEMGITEEVKKKIKEVKEIIEIWLDMQDYHDGEESLENDLEEVLIKLFK